jgi:hypothetical protein
MCAFTIPAYDVGGVLNAESKWGFNIVDPQWKNRNLPRSRSIQLVVKCLAS